MRYKVLAGVVLVALLAVLFLPWLSYHLPRPWQEKGPVIQGVVWLVEPGKTPVRQTAAPQFEDVPFLDIDYGEPGDCAECWRMSCDDDHFGEGYPVKPPWAPSWTILTILIHVLPDYTDKCMEVEG